ncbi:sulfatase-like hydrolase/transferase [Candidatus Latescibacterota bacterium]
MLTTFSRRQFCETAGILSAAMAGSGLPALAESAFDRPNILWLVSEDNGPFLGCYGDENSVTPNLDRFAEESILYENACANAPVCAPARSTLITGMYACSLGTHHMRSKNPIPPSICFFTQYLREAGYYCSNRAKEDYNTIKPDGAWDDSGRDATWRDRKPGQPFFSVVNFGVSHESSLHKTTPVDHDPLAIELPPYHPDTPEVRHDWAQYYDRITEMDRQVGETLAGLDADGLADNTIVFYYSDHGGVLTRSKRFLYDSGVHVPMIVRIPEKYRHLATDRPGSRTDRLVSFVDLAPTVLSLAGIPVPEHMQGGAFLGAQAEEPREYVYLFRGRMDERYDMMRAVRDKRYKYIRNYMPHRIYGQYLQYLWRMPTTRVWEKMYHEGKLSGPQRFFFETKPVEELYDIATDPHEVGNLAENPDYRNVLVRMRKACREWSVDIRDPGFLPEGEMVSRSKSSTPYEMARTPGSYDLTRVMHAAEIASRSDSDNIDSLIGFLDDGDSAVRYWGAVGCQVLGEKALPAVKILAGLLDDVSPDVRVAAAEALFVIESNNKALGVLVKMLDHDNEFVALRSANALDNFDEMARPYIDSLERKLNEDSGYVKRVMEKALADLR